MMAFILHGATTQITPQQHFIITTCAR